MKKIIISTLVLVTLLLGIVGIAEAKTIKVKGYYKPSINRYVAPHYKTSPNRTKLDNYSTKGNYNPFTSKKGYTSPLKSYRLK